MGLRVFFRYLARERLILYNPAAEIDLPRVPPNLPRVMLSREEMETVLAQPNVSTKAGMRDRALFPLAYHHGLRASEVSLLQRQDIHDRQGRI